MNWPLVILCVEIFLCRVFDVSMGTMRTVVTVKGKPFIAAAIGFIEVLVWFLIVREALNTDETSIFVALCYAAGFATGTYVGGALAKRFITCKLDVEIVLSSKNEKVLKAIQEAGYPITIIDVRGYNKNEEKYMLFIEISNKRLELLKKLVLENDPNAFITIDEVKDVHNGYFPGGK